jgi:hypothetical protein
MFGSDSERAGLVGGSTTSRELVRKAVEEASATPRPSATAVAW